MYKINQVVMVTDNTNDHHFTVGSTIILIEKHGDHYYAKDKENRKAWITEKEISHLPTYEKNQTNN